LIQDDDFRFKIKDIRIRQEPKGFSPVIPGYCQPEMFSGNCFLPFPYILNLFPTD
jgi:hypothetical protein